MTFKLYNTNENAERVLLKLSYLKKQKQLTFCFKMYNTDRYKIYREIIKRLSLKIKINVLKDLYCTIFYIDLKNSNGNLYIFVYVESVIYF